MEFGIEKRKLGKITIWLTVKRGLELRCSLWFYVTQVHYIKKGMVKTIPFLFLQLYYLRGFSAAISLFQHDHHWFLRGGSDLLTCGFFGSNCFQGQLNATTVIDFGGFNADDLAFFQVVFNLVNPLLRDL